MLTIDTLREEHTGVLLVLDQLDKAVTAAEAGQPLPTDVFKDIKEFFDVFVDRCHHAKEEAVLFPRLEALGLGGIAQRLEGEHVVGRRLAAAYGEAVAAHMLGETSTGVRLASAARAYASFLRAHIQVETDELFPAIQAALSDQDSALVEAFELIETERIGAGTHERLHAMIDGLPARIEPHVAAQRP